MIQDIMRICPLEAELFYVDRLTEGQIDRRTDICDKANIRSLQLFEHT